MDNQKVDVKADYLVNQMVVQMDLLMEHLMTDAHLVASTVLDSGGMLDYLSEASSDDYMVDDSAAYSAARLDGSMVDDLDGMLAVDWGD